MTYWGTFISGCDMSSSIFLNRKEELEILRSYYDQCVKKNINCGVLIYGWRRVGKTALLQRFVEDLGGVYINCAWISDPKTFLHFVADSLGGVASKDFLEKFVFGLRIDDPMLTLRKALEIFCYPEVYGRKLVVVLDEFHNFVEKISYRISRETKKKKAIVKSDVLWLLREIIESKKAFWILSTSMGWARIHEEYFDESKGEKPLSGTLVKMRIEPLDKAYSIELAKRLNNSIGDEVAEEIYNLSGGIPRIIEIISPNIRQKTTLISTVTHLVKNGQFDEIFENIIKFVAEVTKRDYSVFIETLKVLESQDTPEQVAKKLGIDRVSAYNILEDLVKMEILEKKKIRGRVYYSHLYPLIKVWLKLRVTPIKKITDVLATELGITAEAYIRELLREYMYQQRPLELYEDKKGTYLAGTTEHIAIKIQRVLTPKETQQYLKTKNADIIIIDENNELWLIEIKATLKPITAEDIKKLSDVAKKAKIKNKILAQAGQGEVEAKAISEAIKIGTIIITKQGIKLLAKKIGYPQLQ